MPALTFKVLGVPAPGGSKRAYVFTGKNGKPRANIVDQNDERVTYWRSAVAEAAVRACGAADPLQGPLRLAITFWMPRPKGHWRTGRYAGILKPSAPAYPITTPDLTKLLRAAEDALKGIVWADDSQVVDHAIAKRYVNPRSDGPAPAGWVLHSPGAVFTVSAVAEQPEAA